MTASDKGVEKVGQVGRSKPPPHSPVTDARVLVAPSTQTEPTALSQTPPAPEDAVLTGQVPVAALTGTPAPEPEGPTDEQAEQGKDRITEFKNQVLGDGSV